MRTPQALLVLLEAGEDVDELFEEITTAHEALYDQRLTLGKEYGRRRRELDQLTERLINECTLSDDTKAVIAAIASVEFDNHQTRCTLREVRAKWTAYQAKTKGTK